MIYVITGPPGAGKSTLSRALVKRMPKSIIVPIDDMREWVIGGYSGTFDWCDETERQFDLAERSALAMALIYEAAGFTVILDHCRNIARWEQLLNAVIPKVNPIKIELFPNLDSNLSRNAIRTNKMFNPLDLEPTIRGMHANFDHGGPGWLILDNSSLTVNLSVDEVLAFAADRT